jgi:hypothetical protein
VKQYDKNELFVCDCSDISHNMIFQLWDWGDEAPDLNVNVALNHYLPFHKRIWLAIRYVFGFQSRFGHYDTITIRREDLSRLRAILDEYEKKTDEFNDL